MEERRLEKLAIPALTLVFAVASPSFVTVRLLRPPLLTAPPFSAATSSNADARESSLIEVLAHARALFVVGTDDCRRNVTEAGFVVERLMELRSSSPVSSGFGYDCEVRGASSD